VAEGIMSMKNSNDTIGNRTRDLPACSAVPQPTALPRAPILPYIHSENTKRVSSLGLRIILLTSETVRQNQSLYKADEYPDGRELTDKVTLSTDPRRHRQRSRSSITDAKYVWTVGLSAAASGCITLPDRLCLNRFPTAFREILGVTPAQISASLNLPCHRKQGSSV